VRTITRILALSAFLLGSTVFGQQSTQPKPEDAPKEKKPTQLEEWLGEALRSNPDVRVAEAKFREAEAELNRARMLALQKVVAAQHNIEAATNVVKTAEASVRLSEAKLAEAQTRLDRMMKLLKTGAVSAEEIDQARASVLQAQADLEIAKANLQAAKADVARVQAQMPYLLGKAPANSDAQDRVRERDRLLYARELMAAQEALGTSLLKHDAPVSAPQGATTDKLCKALDKPVSLDFHEAALADILEHLTELSGVSVVNSATGLPNGKIRLKFTGPVPLGAVFQALEDTAGIQFAVRDYGILVVNKVPAGMMSLRTFWKGENTSEKPKTETPSKPKQSRTNPPKDSVEGAVTATEEKDGLVQVSVGSDAGLEKGHTLEVYRKMGDKQFKYVGTVKVEAVEPTRSVGKFVRPPNVPPTVGDRVSSKFFVD
jgi:hypothetical protein